MPAPGITPYTLWCTVCTHVEHIPTVLHYPVFLLLSVVASLTVTLSVFRREEKRDCRHEANRASAGPKHLPCQKIHFHWEAGIDRSFHWIPQSFLLSWSTFSAPLHPPCLPITSRVELSLSITSHLSPLRVLAWLHACMLTNKCVKVRTHTYLRHHLPQLLSKWKDI